MHRYTLLNDIPDALLNKFTIFYMGSEKYFQTFESPERFIRFYKSVPKRLRHYYEVIRKERRKLIIDIDANISEEEIVYIKDKLEALIESRAVIFSSCSLTKTSYHIVAPYLEFHVDDCKRIIEHLDPFGHICDRSVYKNNQFFRIEGSTKYGEYRFKYLLGTNKLSSMSKYFAYTSYITTVKHLHPTKTYTTNNIHIPNCYKIRSYVSDSLISLTRIMPGTCTECKRHHDKENGYLIYNNIDDYWEFRCFRSNF